MAIVLKYKTTTKEFRTLQECYHYVQRRLHMSANEEGVNVPIPYTDFKKLDRAERIKFLREYSRRLAINPFSITYKKDVTCLH